MLCWPSVQVHVGRGYGRVCRRRLRNKLMERCKQQGVQFLPGEMTGHSVLPEHGTAQLTLKDGSRLQSRRGPVCGLQHVEAPGFATSS